MPSARSLLVYMVAAIPPAEYMLVGDKNTDLGGCDRHYLLIVESYSLAHCSLGVTAQQSGVGFNGCVGVGSIDKDRTQSVLNCLPQLLIY